MILDVYNSTQNFKSYRAQRVKSLFNVEAGHEFRISADIPVEDESWQIGVIVGPSGSGKTSLGRRAWEGVPIYNFDEGWSHDRPIVDDIAPEDGKFDDVTGALAAVGLGSVPSWLRPYSVLSNGEKFRAGLARLLCSTDERVIIDEFSSVVDRQVARVGAGAFAKAWRRSKGRRVILLSCHYDVLDWLQPDWIFDTATSTLERGSLRRRPKLDLEIWKVDSRLWHLFEPHYYLKLPKMPAAEYFVGRVDGELVSHIAFQPFFQQHSYRASRMVVMPEWQGAGIGLRFLNETCALHLRGEGRCGRKYPTYFHTSHPGLVAALQRSPVWSQRSAMLFGANKKRSADSFVKATVDKSGLTNTSGFGGHFRAVQGFKYIGVRRQS